MKKKEKEVYKPILPRIGEVDDYHIYQMTLQDRSIGFLMGFGMAAVTSYLFFRSIVFAAFCGVVAGIYAQKPYMEFRKKKRLNVLRIQFRDMLEALASSYMAGRNTMEAFDDCYQDMAQMYGEKADIVRELHAITVGIRSNINIEVLLNNFAERSSLDDVKSFADVFEISFRQGANIKDVISSTRMVLSDKMEIEMEIETMIAGGKNELNVMILMPLAVLLSLGSLGSDMSLANNTPLNVVIKIIVLLIFAGAYKMGKKIMDIKV